MAYPEGWPPRPATHRRSIRFYVEGTTTANFSDNAYLFADQATAATIQPTPVARPGVQTLGIQSPMGGGRVPENARPDLPPTPPGYVDPHPMLFANSIAVYNDGGGDIEITFTDSDTVQGLCTASEHLWLRRERFEAGIAVRGVGGAAVRFRIEAW